MKILYLSDDAACEAPHGEAKDFTVIETIPEDRGRWRTTITVILKHDKTGLFYRGDYQQGNTELQDNDYHGMLQLHQVEPKQVTKTIYVLVKE